tara:strand:- start:2329 stop:2508 length:180 start_codon:yes stop_codon:yes gene_type:complete
MSSKMSTEDLKIYALNSVAVVVSFSEIQEILKLILLVGSIVYTFQRVYSNYREYKKNKK